MTNTQCKVLYEDNHLLAVVKPAGVLTMGDETGDETMVDVVSDYLKQKYNKPGNVFVGVVHRLDRPVSGVLLFARTSKAAARLSDQFRRGVIRKTYVAVIEGKPNKESATLTHWLLKDSQTNTVHTAPSNSARAKKSILDYQVLESSDDFSMVEIHPKTGRSHQIRVQFSAIGHPIVGDTKYGSAVKTGGSIKLHASLLAIEHPTKRDRIQIESPSEFSLASVGRTGHQN